MEILRFRVDDDLQYGVVDPDSGRVVGLKGDPLFSQAEPSGKFYQLDEVRRLSPVIPRSKIVVALPLSNSEAAATRNFNGDTATANCVPSSSGLGEVDRDFPRLTIRPNTTVIGPDDPIQVPEWAGKIEARTSLALVIKTLAKDVPVEDANQVVAGATIATEFFAPEMVAADGGCLSRANCWDTSCPVGPGIVVDPDLQYADLALETRIDGEVVANGTVADFPFGPLEVVSAASQVMTLLPGDLVLVGSLPTPPVVRSGQQVTSWISGLGELENRVF